jgi:hypothetical protein
MLEKEYNGNTGTTKEEDAECPSDDIEKGIQKVEELERRFGKTTKPNIDQEKQEQQKLLTKL